MATHYNIVLLHVVVEATGEVGVSGGAMVGFLALPALLGFSGAANASTLEANMAYGEIGEGLEFGVQLIYLGALLALLGVGSFLVVRQVLVRRELESAAKDLQVCVSCTKIEC